MKMKIIDYQESLDVELWSLDSKLRGSLGG